MKTIVFLISIILLLSEINTDDSCLPLWPRIQFGTIYSDSTSQEKITIKFNTKSECPKSYVIISNSNGTIRKTYCENSTIQCSETMNNYTSYIHRCSINWINFDQKISYIAYGSNLTTGTSVPFNDNPIYVSMVHPNSTNLVKFIVLADWSQLHAKIGHYSSVNQTIDKLRVQQNIQGIIANGDFGYDLDSNNGTNYQQFLNLLSRSGRFVPVFIIAGNHQHNSPDNLKLFYLSFEQYGADKKHANSLNVGPVFFATFDPYQDIHNKSTNLRKQLSSALSGFTQGINNGTNKSKIIIPISHYPLKCSAKALNCQNDTIILKQYFDLMFEHDIKFYVGAHYHTYQRLYPYCQNNTFNLVPPPYLVDNNEKCIISIIQGIAGNDDHIVQTYPNVKDFTAKLSFNKTGVGLLSINTTQIKYQHFSSDNILTLEDQFDIIYKREVKMVLQ